MSKESVKTAEREPEREGLNYLGVAELPELDKANKLEGGLEGRHGGALGSMLGIARWDEAKSRGVFLETLCEHCAVAPQCSHLFSVHNCPAPRQGHPQTGAVDPLTLCPVFRASQIHF